MSFASYRKRRSVSSERALREYLARHNKREPQEQLNGHVATQQSATAFLNSLTPDAFERLCRGRPKRLVIPSFGREYNSELPYM